MKAFSAPQDSLGAIETDIAARIIAAASDFALVLDKEGVILDTASGSEQPAIDMAGRWLGHAWVETVTAETREKIEALIADAEAGNEPRWRQVNHPVPGAPDVPVSYCCIHIPTADRVIAVGRDLSTEANMQRRLVEVQQSLESDYWRLRQAETRYRMLFQMAAEPIVLVDARTRRVQEANPAAARLLELDAEELAHREFPGTLWPAASESLSRMLESVSTLGRADDVALPEARGETSYTVSGSLLRQRTDDLILIRFTPQPEGGAVDSSARRHSHLVEAMEHAPDAVVVTDDAGVILDVNRAFLELAQLSHDHQARRESLDQWLGREGIDLDILLANLRRHGSMPLYATNVRGAHGGTTRVEVAASATAVDNTGAVAYSFFLRNVDTRPGPERRTPMDQDHARSVEQMAQMVGQMPLKDLVKESTDLIERLCIEAALELTNNNRASAAELLGLSRQSLYAKLRRHGLMNLDDSAHS